MDIALTAPVHGCAVAQFFGERPGAYARFGLPGHEGLDYVCAAGTQVHVCFGGVVWRAGVTNGPWGVRIIVKHAWGYSVYAHLSSVGVESGQDVATQQVIGRSGRSGNVTGAHLHFAIALPRENFGYPCPAAMGSHWWHDPMAVGHGLMAVRGVAGGAMHLRRAHRCRVGRVTAEV